MKIVDSTGAELTGGTLLLRTLLVRRLLVRRILAADEKFVGLLLPPSAGAVVANAAVTLGRRVSVNLNYTVSGEILNYCLRQAGIRHVLTSRKFMERFPELKLEADLVFLEDFKSMPTALDKLIAAVQAYALPLPMLERRLGLDQIRLGDLMTVIFTSGSTGQPKGVMLSFGNIGSNTAAIDEVIQLTKEDVLCGIVPFFHSLGFTVALWSVLGLELRGAYHFSPLDARQIGKLCEQNRVTILLATPTFLRSYLRRCQPEEFAALEVVVAGAEKLPVELAEAFEQKFGVRPVEGYGTTELSPLVSVNIPPSRAPDSDRSGLKEGTVGRPVPGVEVKVVHLESGDDLPMGQEGLLLVRGPNVMQGYLGKPETTAKVMRDGWYVTGDIGRIDEEGFIHITGRQSRFSKIGGEMVPHVRVEESLHNLLAIDEQKLCVAVTAVPDPRKGERLVVLHTPTEKQPEQIVKELSAAGLPNLWIPSQDSFFEVAEIPVLGTGKLDLRAVNQLALEKTGSAAARGPG